MDVDRSFPVAAPKVMAEFSKTSTAEMGTATSSLLTELRKEAEMLGDSFEREAALAQFAKIAVEPEESDCQDGSIGPSDGAKRWREGPTLMSGAGKTSFPASLSLDDWVHGDPAPHFFQPSPTCRQEVQDPGDSLR